MSDWETILAMLGNHSRQILYQPLLNQLTNHVLASLLLQQVLCGEAGNQYLKNKENDESERSAL